MKYFDIWSGVGTRFSNYTFRSGSTFFRSCRLSCWPKKQTINSWNSWSCSMFNRGVAQSTELIKRLRSFMLSGVLRLAQIKGH